MKGIAAAGLMLAWLGVTVPAAAAQTDPVADAVEALERGNLPAAEATLRTEVQKHATNADALGVLAVVLDRENKFAEAETFYRRALAQTPRQAALLNNYGNHLAAMGKKAEARDAFLKTVAIQPAHANARLQLARLALERKSPGEALRNLDALPAGQATADVLTARMQALFELKRTREAEDVLARLSAAGGNDAAANRATGSALAAAGQYAKAEDYLARAVQADPGNFEALYSLGLAAAHAGHNERAREVLQSAASQEPENAAVLYDLAAVDAQLGQAEAAVELLARAARIAPDRPDIQQLLARTTAGLGYFGDAIAAWDRYLKLAPADAIARRERAFAATALGDDSGQAMAELRSFAARHPEDAAAHYELGLAEATDAPDDAKKEFTRAIELKPGLGAARFARGLLYLKQGDYAGALPDLEAAVREQPDNAAVVDRLGQCYASLDRNAEAVPLLRKAAQLAPQDSKILLHLGRALAAAGQEEEARAIFARFREAGPDKTALPHPAGLVEFLSLPADEQRARYRAGVERTVARHPDNAEAQTRYLELLLDDGKAADAAATAHRILALSPGAGLLAEAGNALLAAGQYAEAGKLLEKSAATDPSAATLLNLALARFHADGAAAGLEQLDRIPAAQRSGDFYLAQAQMLDVAGRADEAGAALNRALAGSPMRSDLYGYGVERLMAQGRAGDAVALLDKAMRAAPENPDIALMRTIAAVPKGGIAQGEKAVEAIERRWPDWNPVWFAHAVFAGWSGKQAAARRLLDNATALGASDADQRFAYATEPSGADLPLRARRLLESLFPNVVNRPLAH